MGDCFLPKIQLQHNGNILLSQIVQSIDNGQFQFLDGLIFIYASYYFVLYYKVDYLLFYLISTQIDTILNQQIIFYASQCFLQPGSLQKFLHMLSILQLINSSKPMPVVQQANQLNSVTRNSENCQDTHSKILKFVQNYTQKQQAQGYQILQIDSMIGFRISLRSSETEVIFIGQLTYSNGRPIYISQKYRQSLLKKLKQLLSYQFVCYFSDQFGNFVLQQHISQKSLGFNPVQTLAQKLQCSIKCLIKVYHCLGLLGIVKKINLFHYNQLCKRLILFKNVVNVINEQQNENMQANSQNQQKYTGKGCVFRYFNKIEPIQRRQSKSSHKNQRHKINQKSLNKTEKRRKIKAGGYFQIQKKFCEITYTSKDSRNPQNLTCKLNLAEKRLRKDMQSFAYCSKKIEKEIKILNQIQQSQHTVVYWIEENQNNQTKGSNNLGQQLSKNWQTSEIKSSVLDKIYMQYIQETLDDRIYDKKNSIEEIINYSKQIVEGVAILQKSGIIHRDLKPDNFLIKNYKGINNQNCSCIKIIDFAQSCLQKDVFNKNPQNILGATLPYSPPQCYTTCLEGFNSKKIDMWSIGLIVYQILHRKNPLYYSKCLATDIYKGWRMPEQFSLFGRLCKKASMGIVEYIVSIFCLNSVCINQKDRIGIDRMHRIICALQVYLNQINQFNFQ